MPDLLSDLSSPRAGNAILRLLRRAGAASLAPFDVLHRIHWSAPWQERRVCACGIERGQ